MLKGVFVFVLVLLSFLTFQNWKVDPAVDFLNSLTEAQRNKTQLEMSDEGRMKWHFLPTRNYKRDGLPLYEMSDDQKESLLTLLKNYLSEAGYEKTQRIIGLEEVLAELENDPEYRDPEKYFVTFYGDPEEDETWAWSFEGHHISLHFTIVDGDISMAPRFFGANPARIPSGEREGERTLDVEEDLGLELINTMSAQKQERAIFSLQTFRDIVTMNASKVDPLDRVGIPMKELNKKEKALVWAIIDEFLSAMPIDLAEKRSENIASEEEDEITFGWAGALKLGQPHYYRIQGKTFLIEFDNTQNNANHIHTIWRDFDGDFGRDLIREHYQNSDHH
ncbi:DUF3500 domain-containing protein [Membranihabitans marinus]|uniref:DUF3500 domain-containing protein n=1 Tax=Membranihabitans marinus TaxID=1227546 RepID=UPI001F441765|nr:DUF3500 domain-containing protein [Membranihabitans marinus]